MLCNGEWYDATAKLAIEGMTLGDLREALAANYQLEDKVAEQLTLKSYRNPNAPLKKRKGKYINDLSATIPIQDMLQKKGQYICRRARDRQGS